MRIKELLEGKNFKDMDWVSRDGETSELNFNLAEDLVFFMNNDDDTYRRHVYPSIVRCMKGNASSSVFSDAVKESYKNYVRQYPIRELPDEIDEKICKEACDMMHEEVSQHINDGKYKD
jgi:hypothetical protein